MTATNAPKPTVKQIALGIFVVWQLVFLVGYNSIVLLREVRLLPQPAENRTLALRAIDGAADVFYHWSLVSAQWQKWELFLNMPSQCAFLDVELRWDGAQADPGPIKLTSFSEPADPDNYIHWPGSMDRLFYYEFSLGRPLLYWNETFVREAPAIWRQTYFNEARAHDKPMLAYLRWRLRRFQRAHPELPPPRQVLLSVRLQRTPPPVAPPEDWQHVVELPLARWFPEKDHAPDDSELEFFDLVSHRYERLPAQE